MTEAIEVLQNEIGKINSHIREMKRMSDVVQCDLVKDWPTKVTELEIAVERLLKIEGADNFTKSNKQKFQCLCEIDLLSGLGAPILQISKECPQHGHYYEA